ncbi:MAG: TlpA family protein disulfide reductase, partial [Thermoguttaceae bacterium]|nr:TlpA family protein disulfide reductase [Thermoguttaceae bacterium]
NKGTVDNSSLNGKIAIVNFWTTWSKLEPTIQPQLNQLRQKYEKDDDVVFLSVSTDETSVSDAVLRDSLKQWNAPLDCVRDDNGYLTQELKINSVPAMFVLNKDGVIEALEMGFNPLLVNIISDCIDQIKNGGAPYKQTLDNKKTEAAQYEEHRKEWIKRGIFVDADVIEMSGIPETVAAQPSQPRQFELKPLWTAEGIQNPGGLLAEDSPEGTAGRVWVIENGKKIVQIDSSGRIESRYDLDLNPKEICSFIRKNSSADKSDVRFLAFAPGQQRIHVYDQNWKNLFHYPDNALEHPHDGIQDARFGNLTNDKTDEIYIGYLGTRGVQSIDLSGQLRWSNRTLGTVFSIAPYHNQQENLLLCCAGSSGMITVLKSNGKTLGDKNNIGVIGLKDQLAAMVYSAKMKKGVNNPEPSNVPENDSLCALCANQNSYLLVGFNMRSEILWTYELPQGIPKRPIDYLTSADVIPNGPSIWIALGSDGSIHFIEADGLLIDSFNHGQFVYGLAVANWNGQRVLILSDDQGVKAYQIIWK